jgi:acetyltransferase-like isoleucine patch superfamily enzyme
MTIGAHCNIAPDCNLSDGDFHEILDETGAPVGSRNKPVVIGDHVWIAVGVIVLKGVTIGAGSVLGAGSVVTRDIPAGVVAVGNPARVLKKIAGWR